MREDDGGGAVDGRAVKRRSAARGEEAGEKSRSGISMFLMVSLRKQIDRGCQVEFWRGFFPFVLPFFVHFRAEEPVGALGS